MDLCKAALFLLLIFHLSTHKDTFSFKWNFCFSKSCKRKSSQEQKRTKPDENGLWLEKRFRIGTAAYNDAYQSDSVAIWLCYNFVIQLAEILRNDENTKLKDMIKNLGLVYGNLFIFMKILPDRLKNWFIHHSFIPGMSLSFEMRTCFLKISKVIKSYEEENKLYDSQTIRFGSIWSEINGLPAVDYLLVNEKSEKDTLKYKELYHLEFDNIIFYCTDQSEILDDSFKKRKLKNVNRMFIRILGILLDHPFVLYFLYGTNYWSKFLNMLCNTVGLNSAELVEKLTQFLNKYASKRRRKKDEDFLENIAKLNDINFLVYDRSENLLRYVFILAKIKRIARSALYHIEKGPTYKNLHIWKFPEAEIAVPFFNL